VTYLLNSTKILAIYHCQTDTEVCVTGITIPRCRSSISRRVGSS